MSKPRTKWATCRECNQPMQIEANLVRGDPHHGECWLVVLRRRWRHTKDPATKAAIESTAAAVAADLGRR